MANRLIPYGYKNENGRFIAESAEAAVLLNIYENYNAGESLMQIADKLNRANTVFYLGKCGWSKARLKRILEDRRYLGEGEYPQIIPRELYEKAVQLIRDKSNGYNLDPVSSAMKQKAYCDECGSKMIFNHKCKGYPKWECGNPSCVTEENIRHRRVLTSLINIMNAVIANTKLFRSNENNSYSPDAETTQKLNEINRKMNQRNIDFKSIQAEILAYADMLYQKCEAGIHKGLTESLMQIYTNRKITEELDTALFESTVSMFNIAKDGAVTVCFANGANITERSITDAKE